MDPVTSLMVLGFVGGLFVAFSLAGANRRSTRVGQPPARDADGLITDAFNISHIRVAGVGGLGFVVMALVVAAFVPSIGAAMAIGLTLGAMLAVVLILWRRRAGPMRSSGRRPGANTTLSIDTVESPLDNQAKGRISPQKIDLATALPKRSWS
jgi:hypothetical protein